MGQQRRKSITKQHRHRQSFARQPPASRYDDLRRPANLDRLHLHRPVTSRSASIMFDDCIQELRKTGDGHRILPRNMNPVVALVSKKYLEKFVLSSANPGFLSRKLHELDCQTTRQPTTAYSSAVRYVGRFIAVEVEYPEHQSDIAMINQVVSDATDRPDVFSSKPFIVIGSSSEPHDLTRRELYDVYDSRLREIEISLGPLATNFRN